MAYLFAALRHPNLQDLRHERRKRARKAFNRSYRNQISAAGGVSCLTGRGRALCGPRWSCFSSRWFRRWRWAPSSRCRTRRTASRSRAAAIPSPRRSRSSSIRNCSRWACRFHSRCSRSCWRTSWGTISRAGFTASTRAIRISSLAPTFFGTFGAFIRIRSPITTQARAV